MAGFDNDCMYADNADFTTAGAGGGSSSNGLATNGQLWIGTTAVNAGGTHINVGAITSPLGTLTVGYSSPNITVDLKGGSTGVDSFAMQTGTSPIFPNGSGLVTFSGAVVAAGTNPVRTDGTAANTMTLEVQTSQALAAADATKIGLCNFSSGSFAVAATGFVTLLGMPWTEVTGTTQAAAVNNGYIANNAGLVSVTLPATAALGSIVHIVGKGAGGWSMVANTGQTIIFGNQTSSSAGSVSSTLLSDAFQVVCTTANTTWTCTGVSQGNLTVA